MSSDLDSPADQRTPWTEVGGGQLTQEEMERIAEDGRRQEARLLRLEQELGL